MNRCRRWPLSLFTCLAALSTATAQDGDGKAAKKDRDPTNVSLSDTPAMALKKFTVAPGLQVDVWASEPLLANVVAFSFDDRGRCFVAETYRRRTSAPDIRKNMDWILPDLALRSVAERERFLQEVNSPDAHRKPDKEHLDVNGDGQFDWHDLTLESEGIRLVEDRDGDGVAETANLFAEGFNTLTTGVAAGVMVYGDNVWFACIPDLWRMEGASSAVATKKEAILSGFGVHVAYSGHDMHGVKMGPDGKVYWSIADCGAKVKTKEGTTLNMPDAGAVFRANPDGTQAEIVAYGLRNPQSLAWNDVGDLFTGDNNADGGDKARWEHVVEGGDYGWRMGWQFLPKLGAWNGERLWDLDIGETAPSSLPPVGHIGHGPAGIAYYPGTGLPDSYRDHFFYADFPGGVRSFKLEPKGASYTVSNPDSVLMNNKTTEMTGKLVWGMYPSDVQFGVDGGVYVLDWVQGWEKTGLGRIFRVHAPEVDKAKATLETKALLGKGMEGRPEKELLELLSHGDQRVRMAAQFALAARGQAALPLLEAAASAKSAGPDKHTATLGRLHAIWGLGQIGRQTQEAYRSLAGLLKDSDAEVRAQAAKILGEARAPREGDVSALLAALRDTAPRVRFFAAQSLGKLNAAGAVQPLVEMLRTNVKDDAFLRHATVLALSRIAPTNRLTDLWQDRSENVRLGAVLALRRQKSQGVTYFLRKDESPRVAMEAVRAIHDEPISVELHTLALLLWQGDLPTPVARRAINAAYRLGSTKMAEMVAGFALSKNREAAQRVEALEALGQWSKALGRDRVLGVWSPELAKRTPESASAPALAVLDELLGDPDEAIRVAAAEMAGGQQLAGSAPKLLAVCASEKESAPVRLAALKALVEIEIGDGSVAQKEPSAQLKEAIAISLKSPEKALSLEARRFSAKFSPNDAVGQATLALESGSVAEKQGALQTLGTAKDHEADKLIAKWLDRLAAGKVPAALQLELLEAAALRKDGRVKDKLAAYEASRPATDPLAKWQECLEGGDAALGKQIFAEKAEAACQRCHKVKGEGGDVGPDLAGIATRHDRAYLLASVATPNATIAEGFENVLLTLKDGSFVVGIASSENESEIVITPLTGGAKIPVKKANVTQRDRVPSPMPEGLAEVLGKRDLRNVVEYLGTLK